MIVNLTGHNIMSFTDFMRILEQALTAAWGKEQVRFHSAYPKVTEGESFPTPIITYAYFNKRPGEFNNTREIKPRQRGEVQIDVAGKLETVAIMGQMFDMDLQLEIWGSSGEEADRIAEDLQRFMFQYTGYFKKQGISELIFEKADAGQVQNPWKSGLIRRELTYHVRMDEVLGIQSPTIEAISFEATVHSSEFKMLFHLIDEGRDLY